MPKVFDEDMVNLFSKQLFSGVIEGYGSNFVGIDYDTPDAKMLLHLQKNVYQFSAAKNWHQIKALTEALIGDDNKLRSYSQFKKVAYQINDTQVNTWLKTEYNTAIAGGQMAAKWVNIQANKDTLTLLEFDAVIDGRTSDLCHSFNKIVLPVTDSFWKTNYPPNHFSCRSSVRQLSSGKETNKRDIVYPEKLPPMFQVNLAEQGLAFPPKHPYWDGVPKSFIKPANNLIK